MGMVLTVCALARGEARVIEAVDVGPVWAGHSVGFALLTHGGRQYAGHYDDQRRMTIASREIRSQQWTHTVLPSSVGWDSHNYITMTVDDVGQLHVAGNMHAGPLIYFRTRDAGNAATLERIEKMVGKDEERCTYPQFMRGPGNELIFTYRSGQSGNGNQIYNVYDAKTATWRRMLDEPLTDGGGKMNAYFDGPRRGPDGNFHLCWVWRDHGGCETNHDLSYARSKDLRHWESSDGRAVKLPMSIDNCEIVDRVPVRGGMINGNARIGFDSQKRVIISYHKFDEAGKTQVYNARLEEGKWMIHRASDWDYRWDFGGTGSIVFEIRLGAVQLEKDGSLSQTYSHVKHGSGVWRLDEKTLRAVGKIEREPVRPRELEKLESAFPGMQVRWTGDSGKSDEAGTYYTLRWETLGTNRDKPRTGDLPPASMLRVYKIKP